MARRQAVARLSCRTRLQVQQPVLDRRFLANQRPMRTCSPTCQARATIAALTENFRKLSANARAVISVSIDSPVEVI